MTSGSPCSTPAKLRDTEKILFCGFGQVSEASARVFIRRRFPIDHLSALTDKLCRYDAARALGVDATRVKALTAASIVDHVGLGTAQLIVDIVDDTRLVRMLLVLKRHFPEAKVAAVAIDPRVSRTLTLHGISDVVCIPQLAGLLLAQTVIQPQTRPRRDWDWMGAQAGATYGTGNGDT